MFSSLVGVTVFFPAANAFRNSVIPFGEPDFKPPEEVKTALAEVYDKGYGSMVPQRELQNYEWRWLDEMG